MDPRDPRAPGNDHSPGDTGWGAELPPLRPPEEELTERYGPPAPEPEWEEPAKPSFDREKFLLIAFLTIVGFQYAVLTAGIGVCAYFTLFSIEKYGHEYINIDKENRPGCVRLADRVENTFDLSINVILALLGGTALASRPIAQSFRKRTSDEPSVPPPRQRPPVR